MKKDVDRYCTDNGYGSRVTVWKAIDLFDPDVIEVKKARQNSMKHPLFIRPGNYLTLTMKELDAFEQAFFELLQATIPLYVSDYKEWLALAQHTGIRAPDIRDPKFGKYPGVPEKYQVKLMEIGHNRMKADAMFLTCIIYYNKVLLAYVMKSMTKWPNNIENHLFLNKLVAATFNRLYSIQEKMITMMSEADFEINPNLDKDRYGWRHQLQAYLFQSTIKDLDREDYWDRARSFKRNGGYGNPRAKLAHKVEKIIGEIIKDLSPENGEKGDTVLDILPEFRNDKDSANPTRMLRGLDFLFG